MKIESTAFAPGDHIPNIYTQFGENLSPALFFHNIPPGTQSLALIADDPDAPKGLFTHWIVFNLDPTVDGLPQNVLIPDSVHATQGTNDAGTIGYIGPRPPSGEHHYHFHLYALDAKLDLPSGAKRAEIDRALRGHIITEAQLTGLFATPAEVVHHPQPHPDFVSARPTTLT